MLDKIKLLDAKDDKSWTSDGLPAVAAVKAITGDDTITRADINKAAFGLTRENVATWQPAVVETVAPVVPVKQDLIAEPVAQDLDPMYLEIQTLRDKSSELQAAINASTIALHENDAQLKALESKLPEKTDPNHHASGYAEYMASVQAHKLALAEKGLLQPAPIDQSRRRYNPSGRRFR